MDKKSIIGTSVFWQATVGIVCIVGAVAFVKSRGATNGEKDIPPELKKSYTALNNARMKFDEARMQCEQTKREVAVMIQQSKIDAAAAMVARGLNENVPTTWIDANGNSITYTKDGQKYYVQLGFREDGLLIWKSP